MIALAVACDVGCGRTVSRDGASVRDASHQLTDLLATAARLGWWVDDLGRAWCPTHRATPAIGDQR